jgi:hypothetical protein
VRNDIAALRRGRQESIRVRFEELNVNSTAAAAAD